jgi:hypothetical protein
MKVSTKGISLLLNGNLFDRGRRWFDKNTLRIVIYILTFVSVAVFLHFSKNGLNLAYNDARSHLDIGRRVVEGLKVGLAQLGSVWLPLPHILMVPTVWNDYFWHSGLSGSLQSMISFVATGVLIYKYLEKLKVGMVGRLFAVLIFAANINILYLQSTAMTELLLLATMTAGAYYLMLWLADENLLSLVQAAFWIMMSTAIRYDGWFLFLFSTLLIGYTVIRKKGYVEAEGVLLLFMTLGGFAIILWLLWNLLIFGDPLYFAFGPYSAHAQQAQIYEAGELFSKGNLWLSVKAYIYAVFYNMYTLFAILGVFGFVKLWKDKRLGKNFKLASVVLLAPFIFNVLALYLGHSVLFVVGVVNDTWFNVRYGTMLVPSIAVFSGFLVDKLKNFRWPIIGLSLTILIFAYYSSDIVTLDDALIGASGKNVAEVSSWLKANASDEDGFILMSVASHDAIVFSSGLPMEKFIHEGTGKYWDYALQYPDKWAKWIVMRTNDTSDVTFRELKDNQRLNRFELVDSYPFADIYKLKDEYKDLVYTKPLEWIEE